MLFNKKKKRVTTRTTGLVEQCNVLLESLRNTDEMLDIKTRNLKFAETILKFKKSQLAKRKGALRKISSVLDDCQRNKRRSYKQRYAMLEKVIKSVAEEL